MSESWMTVDTKLDALKEIIDAKQSQEKKNEFVQFEKMYDVIKKFLIKNNLVLYGGVALNELLPDKHKIYENNEIPDYDCFSYKAKQHALELGKELKKAGYNYVEVKSGVHAGTIKVFAEFKAAADFTQVTKSFYQFLLQESLSNNTKYQSDTKLTVAPPVFLKWSFYKELSRPEGSLFRWEKIYHRYHIFMKEHGTDKNKKVSIPNYRDLLTTPCDDPNIQSIISQVDTMVKTHKMPIIGNMAVGVYLSDYRLFKGKLECCKLLPTFSKFDVMSEDVQNTVKAMNDFIKLPKGYSLVAKPRGIRGKGYFDDVMPLRIRLFVKIPQKTEMYSLASIHDVSGNCYSTVNKNGYTVGTADTVLQYLYAYYMTYTYFEKQTHPEYAEHVWKLISIFEKYTNTKLDIAERFSTICFGKENTLLNVKKENWNKKNFVHRF